MVKITLSITLLAITLWFGVIPLKVDHHHNFYKKKAAKKDSTIFQITRDTVNVNIIGKLSRGLLINNKYYAFYEVRDPRSTQDIKKFYIINKNGQVEQEIKVHDDIKKDTYPKLYFWHGRIMVNTVFYKNTYFLDLDKGEFIKNQDLIIPPLFDDGHYVVTSDCRGEFGSDIYFKNKLTGIVYETGLGCPVTLNKVDDKYYIQSNVMLIGENTKIIEIDDPAKMRISSTTPYSEIDYKKGVKIIYSDNSSFPNYYIPTSFIYNKDLYVVYNTYKEHLEPYAKKDLLWITKDTVRIGIINGNKFKALYTFKDKIDIQFEQQLSLNYQICTFHTESRQTIGFKEDKPPYREAKYGFIEITGNKINIHYFISKITANKPLIKTTRR